VSKPADSPTRLQELRQAVEERPDDARAHLKLGMALARMESVHKAEQTLRKAVELDPELVEGWVNLGGVLLSKWDFEGCVEANRQAQKVRPDLFEAHYNEGLGHMYLKDEEAMLASFERVVELRPDHPAGVYHLAVAQLAVGQVTEARRSLTRATELGHSPAPEFIRTLEKEERNQKLPPDDGATKSN
jgi:Flp pilus assembly protein TadD